MKNTNKMRIRFLKIYLNKNNNKCNVLKWEFFLFQYSRVGVLRDSGLRDSGGPYVVISETENRPK